MLNVPYQVLVGLNVLDDKRFDEFHSAIEPLLSRYQGQLGYEFTVPASLLARHSHKVNRVYTISFASKERMESYFADSEYLKTRGRHILKSFATEQFIFGYEHDQPAA